MGLIRKWFLEGMSFELEVEMVGGPLQNDYLNIMNKTYLFDFLKILSILGMLTISPWNLCQMHETRHCHH